MGLGEVMNMCLAPAVSAAVHDATGYGSIIFR
jgi:CO/xanthine dehydrogenase Mo-binding subunit